MLVGGAAQLRSRLLSTREKVADLPTTPGPAQVAEQWVLADPTSWGQRLRSGLVLALIVAMMGAMVAVAFSALAVLVALVFQRVVS